MSDNKFKVDGGFESLGDGEINGTLDMSGFAVVNLGNPTTDDSAATSSWIQSQILTQIGTYDNAPEGWQPGDWVPYSGTVEATIERTISPYNDSNGGGSHYGLAITDDKIIIGYSGRFQYAQYPNDAEGEVRVFDLATGTELQIIGNPSEGTSSDHSTQDYFGWNVLDTGSKIFISSHRDDQSSTRLRIGKVFIYTEGDSSLTAAGGVMNPRYASSDSPGTEFGKTIAVSGNIFYAWSDYPSGSGFGNGIGAGRVERYDMSQNMLHLGHWSRNEYGNAYGDKFGEAMAGNDKYIVIAAPGEDTVETYDAEAGSGPRAGYVYVYQTNGTHTPVNQWTFVNPRASELTPTIYTGYGNKVAVHGDYLVVSAPYESEPIDVDNRIGAVYVYDIPTTTLLYKIDAPAQTSNYRFGVNLHISEAGVLYVSAEGGGNPPGYLYAYELATGNLIYTFPKPNGNQAYDWFAENVTSKGNWLLVSAPGEGTDGRTYLYDVSTLNLSIPPIPQ